MEENKNTVEEEILTEEAPEKDAECQEEVADSASEPEKDESSDIEDAPLKFKDKKRLKKAEAELDKLRAELADEQDDIIDDARLYFLFVRLAGQARQLDDPEQLEIAMQEALADYVEPVPGARERIEKALRIMLVAWLAAKMRQSAEQMLAQL